MKTSRAWLINVGGCLNNCKRGFWETRFLWHLIFLAIAFLYVSLTLVEGFCGNTKVEIYRVPPKFAPELFKAYGVDPSLKHWVLESCTWQQAISADPCKLFDLLWESLYVTLISVTTIGFGDVVPSHPVGKLIAVADAVVGFFAFGLYVNTLMYGLRGVLPGHHEQQTPKEPEDTQGTAK